MTGTVVGETFVYLLSHLSEFSLNDRSFRQDHAVFEVVWKNFVVQPGSPQMPISNGACALHAGYLRLRMLTQNM